MRMVNSNNEWIDEPRVNNDAQVDHNMLGSKKSDNGKYEDVINEFTKSINQNPNDANAYFSRATLRVRIGDIEGARRDFIICEYCDRINNSKVEDFPLV